MHFLLIYVINISFLGILFCKSIWFLMAYKEQITSYFINSKGKLKMKKYFLLLSFVLYLMNFSIASAEEAPIIVDQKKAISFGIWRIYNTGSRIYFIDEKDRRFVVTTGSNDYGFFVDGQHNVLDGSGLIFNGDVLSSDPSMLVEGLETKLSGQLRDGRYSFGSKKFDVVGDTLALFNGGQAGLSGNTTPITILKKYSNGLVHKGMDLTQTFDPSVVLDENDVLGPVVTVGDCLVTYFSETGRVDIPCLSVKERNTIYNVELQKQPDSLAFEVNVNDIIRVQ